LKGQSRIYNPEKLAMLCAQDMERTKTLVKTEGAIKDGQYWETSNTRYTRHGTNKTSVNTDGAIKNRQSRYWRH